MKSSCLWALLCAALAPPAIADTTFKVGLGAGCTHSTIQSALDAAANDGNQPSLIVLTRSLSYTNQALRINDPESVELRGGFERCSDAEASGGYTRIDGAGGTAQSVIAVVGSYRSRVRLAALEISGGDAENHIIDQRRVDLRPFNRRPDDMTAQRWRFSVVERPAKGLADGGAGGADDDGFFHGEHPIL